MKEIEKVFYGSDSSIWLDPEPLNKTDPDHFYFQSVRNLVFSLNIWFQNPSIKSVVIDTLIFSQYLLHYNNLLLQVRYLIKGRIKFQFFL